MTDIERAIKNIKNRNFCGMCTTATTKELNSCAECENYQAKKLALEALQEKRERRWIPVSERLPKPQCPVLLYLSDDDTCCCLVGYLFYSKKPQFTQFNGQWSSVDGGGMPQFLDTKYVIAWQPLPEPWEGEGL